MFRGNFYREDFTMSETFLCSSCGREHPICQRITFDGKALCPNCLAERTTLCRVCGERILREDNAGTEMHPLCQACFDDYYTTCTRCGMLLRRSEAFFQDSDEDEEYPYCNSCYYASPKGINDYYYKPEPIFHGDGPRYMGVELEIDGAGELDSKASQILDVANRGGSELLYCKHDGSLDDGFELVSHPMSLDFHQKGMPWAAVLEEAVRLGYQSHQASTCGLHVHVSRAAFGVTEAEQDATIARILYFFEKHWEELLKFSRRTPRQLERWAARYGYKEQPRDILDHAKKGYGVGRYTCVNLTNEDTIEFRIFRGTLKLNTLIATLQLVDRICDVALCLSDEELKAMSWTTFVSGWTQPELVQYLKERRLYVNEPVEAEVEL